MNRKVLLIISMILFLLPFFTIAKSCDNDKVTISSITVENKSDNVEELNKATTNNKNINLNLSMSEVGNFIEYKIILKNNSNDDYKLDKNRLNITSNYIDYIIESKDKSIVVKSNSSKTIYLKVQYKNNIPDDEFNSGVYNDNKTIVVNLSTRNALDIITNPKTGNYAIYLFGIVLIISGTLFIILRKNKYAKTMMLIFTAIMIPMSVYAICKFNIKITSNVEIKTNNPYVYTVNIRDSSKPDNNLIQLNQQMPDTIITYQTPQEAMQSFSNKPFFLKHKLSNNIVTESYLGFVVTNAMAESNPGMTAGTYYLRGGVDEYMDSNKPFYNANKETLFSAFGSSNCTASTTTTSCEVPGLHAAAATFDGNIAAYVDDNNICFVNGGNSYCSST